MESKIVTGFITDLVDGIAEIMPIKKLSEDPYLEISIFLLDPS